VTPSRESQFITKKSTEHLRIAGVIVTSNMTKISGTGNDALIFARSSVEMQLLYCNRQLHVTRGRDDA
ncbi:MAG TPA: hypothetical protein VF713_15490, partial [Thermoanaerobaculia bacterium]